MFITESRGKAVGNFLAFFIGHHRNIEVRYTTNKGILSENPCKRDASILLRDHKNF